MLALLIAPLVLTYEFRPEVRHLYDVNVQFEGYVPVLGGTNGKIDVQIALAVQGASPDEEGRPQVTSEIDDFAMRLNGARMPFDKSNILSYFPKTTVSIDPRGKVLKTDAPNLALPVRLPGLDVKRFPDITYLLLEFPEDGVEVGKAFEFKKSFVGSEATYQVMPQEITEGLVKFTVKVKQAYTAFEDTRNNPVPEADATTTVETTVDGEGDATYDQTRHQVVAAKIVATAQSVATEKSTGEKSERKLKTTLTVKRREN